MHSDAVRNLPPDEQDKIALAVLRAIGRMTNRRQRKRNVAWKSAASFSEFASDEPVKLDYYPCQIVGFELHDTDSADHSAHATSVRPVLHGENGAPPVRS